MPKGEGQSGKRRGRYGQTTEIPLGEWSEDDSAHEAELYDSSPLEHEATRREAARRAVECRRLLRSLDLRQGLLTVDEQKLIVSASKQYQNWLHLLAVTGAKRKRAGGGL